MQVQAEIETWSGCYDDGWRGIIVDAAFAHPAKMARGLVRRIFDDLDLPPGSTVVDPFGGIGTTGIEAASRGLRAFLYELEPKFVALAQQNFAKWKWGAYPPVIVQGDSRNLRAVLGPVLADCVVSSPPYTESTVHGGGHGIDWEKAVDERAGRKSSPARHGLGEGYGSTPGQLGAMPPGSVDAVVSSPPYSTDQFGGGGNKHDKVIDAMKAGYGSTPGQLEGLPSGRVDAVVSSPPYEGTPLQAGGDNVAAGRKRMTAEGKWSGDLTDGENKGYGTSPDQLGNSTGETFWLAARQIVAECHAILKPGGVAVWVCKDFVRKGERVPFSADWVKLCEACGFTLTKWVRASLVKEDRHAGFWGEQVKTTERKSFFRRLAEKKGSPRIDHEDVLFLTSRA